MTRAWHRSSDQEAKKPGGRAGTIVCLALLASMLIWMGTTQRIYAQTRPIAPRYTFALVGVPLTDALERVIDETRLSLVYTSDLVAGRTTFCKAERVRPEQLLSCILRGTGLDYVQLSTGTYVLRTDVQTPPHYGRLTGQIADAETGMPLADASVLLRGAGTGTATNRDGRFAFADLKPGPHQIIITHVAYHDAADTVYVGPNEHRRVALDLRPRIVLAEPVVINGFGARLPSEKLGANNRTDEELVSSDGAGVPDVVQGLEGVAGVRLGDALSDVHVQGGAANEQQFLLDGVPVFMPVPTGGFISPFSAFALNQVTVRKAGFGARHGSHLSGVIDVEHQLAPKNRQRLTAQVDPLSLNARWTERLTSSGAPDVTWMLTGRKGIWDMYQPESLSNLLEHWSRPDGFLLNALHAPTQRPVRAAAVDEVLFNRLEVGFTDLHGAARIRTGTLSSLHLSAYRGANTFGTESVTGLAGLAADDTETDVFEDAYRWRNHAGQLRYEWVPSGRFLMNANVWGTDYRLNHPTSLGSETTASSAQSTDALRSEEFNRIAEVGIRLQGDLAASTRHYVSGAVEAVHTGSNFALSLDPFGAAPTGENEIHPVQWRVASFLEDRLTLTHRASLTLGTRLTYVPTQRTAYAEPRLAFRYDREVGPQGSWATRWAVGLYRQYLHSFDVATYNVAALLPRVRFWLPIGRRQRPPEAYHATAAFLYQPDARWTFSMESYYKHQPHLLVLDYGRRSAADATGDLLTTADGYAYGAALTASRTTQRLQLEVQYEYAVARRRIPNRFDGAFVPVPWSAPHRLHLSLDLHPLPHWTATVRWQGVFGRSWGFRQAYYDFLEPDPATRRFGSFDLSDPAAHRLPAFSQWDLGLSYTRTIAGVGLQGRITLINLLGRDNVSDWSLRYNEQDETYVRARRLTASFIPSASLRISL